MDFPEGPLLTQVLQRPHQTALSRLPSSSLKSLDPFLPWMCVLITSTPEHAFLHPNQKAWPSPHPCPAPNLFSSSASVSCLETTSYPVFFPSLIQLSQKSMDSMSGGEDKLDWLLTWLRGFLWKGGPPSPVLRR